MFSFTEQGPRTFHRTLGPLLVRALQSCLERDNGTRIVRSDNRCPGKCKGLLRNISKDINSFSKIQSDRRRSKLKSSYWVQVDAVLTQRRPVIDMVDAATHFCAASFLGRQSMKEIWNWMQHMWSLVYLAPPDVLVVEQGTTYNAKEMRETLKGHGVHLDRAAIEAPGAIGTVEGYHAQLRLMYGPIRAESNKSTTDQKCFDLALFVLEYTVRLEGLYPTSLVFGGIPRSAKMTIAPTQMKEARIIDSAMMEVKREQTRRKISFGLRQTSFPKAKEWPALLRELSAGSPVVVFTSVITSSEGPFKFIYIEGEAAVVQTPRDRKIFRSTCVNPSVNPPIAGLEVKIIKRAELYTS